MTLIELLRRCILNFACFFRRHELAYAMVFWTGEDAKQASRLVDLLKTAHSALHHKPALAFWPLDPQEKI